MQICGIFGVYNRSDSFHISCRRSLGLVIGRLAFCMGRRKKTTLPEGQRVHGFCWLWSCSHDRGAAALMGSIFLGPRTGRFTPTGSVVDMPGHSTVLAALGTFILWFGWYGFNPVSTLEFKYMGHAARVAVTATLAAATGGCTTLAVHVALKNPPDVFPALNGILAGLVFIQDLVLLLNRGQLPSLVLLGALYTMDRVRYSRSCRSTIP